MSVGWLVGGSFCHNFLKAQGNTSKAHVVGVLDIVDAMDVVDAVNVVDVFEVVNVYLILLNTFSA